MHVVVTGSSGTVGTALREQLRRRGDRVTRLVRRPPQSEDEAEWEPAEGRLDPAVLAGADAVVHLAGVGIGEHRWTDSFKRALVDSRLQGTTLLAERMAGSEARPPVLVSASGVNYYGSVEGAVVDEGAPPGEGFLADLCRRWEEATGAASRAGVRVTNLRSGVIYAKGSGALGRQVPLFRFGLGGRLASGEQWTPWIGLTDEVRAILHLLDHDVEGPVNVASPLAVTNAEFTKALGRVLHRPTIFPAPKFGLRLVVGKEMTEELVLLSLRVAPTKLTASGFTFLHPDVEDALRTELER